MAKKISIKLDVDTKSLGQLEDMLNDVNEQLKDADRNSDAFKELAAKSQILTKEIEKINNEIDGFKLEDKLMAADGAAKVFGGSLSAAVGALGTLGVESEAFGEFEEKAASAIAVGLGIKDVSEGFGQLRIAIGKSGIASKLFGTTTKKALISTGIGAFVVALGTVIAYWDDINKGIKRFVNNVPFVGKAIEAVQDAFNYLYDAAKPILQFLGILPSEAEIAQEKLKDLTSETIKELERELALAQARGDSEKELFEIRQKLLQEELALLQQNNEDKDAIFKKETELLALQLAEQKRLREEAAGIVQREKVETVNAIKAKGDAQLEVNNEIKTSDTDLRKFKEINDRDEALRDKLLQEQKIALTSDTLGQVAGLLGENSAVGKAAAIAQATINSYLGFTDVLKTPTTIPEPFGSIQKGISAAAILASGLATVKSIATVQTPTSAPTPTASAPQAPAFNVVGAAPENQLAQTLGQAQDKPVKAFVVSSEVSSQQALDRKIETGASLG